MVGKTFKKTIAKGIASVTTAVFAAGCFSGAGFAAEAEDVPTELAMGQQTDILSMVMDSALEITNPFEHLIVSDYEPYLAVYAQTDATSEVVGKLYPGSYGEVVEKGEQWTKITSGYVTGYVLTADVAFGDEAEALAETVGEKVVKVEVDALNIRSGPDFYSDVISAGKKDATYRIVPDGSEYDEETGEIVWTEQWLKENGQTEDAAQAAEVQATAAGLAMESAGDTQEQEVSGPSEEEILDPIDDYSGGQWYRIHLDDIYYGYVYADYVSVENQLDEAVSVEEEEKLLEQQRLAEETAAQESTSAQTETQQKETSESQTQTTTPETKAPADSSQTLEDSQTSGQSQTQPAETESQTEAPETEVPSASSDDAYLLACLVYCEAGNQSYEGQLAVANVVLNRVKSPLFPNTISEVIYQSGQFSPASSGSLARTLANGPTDSCVQAANDALAGNNNVGNYLFFNNFGAPANASSSMTIGDHIFYTYNY